MLVVKNGLAKVVEVGTGSRESGNVEITSGLNVGDTVIVTGVLFARPGTPVTIRAVKTLENASPASN